MLFVHLLVKKHDAQFFELECNSHPFVLNGLFPPLLFLLLAHILQHDYSVWAGVTDNYLHGLLPEGGVGYMDELRCLSALHYIRQGFKDIGCNILNILYFPEVAAHLFFGGMRSIDGDHL